MTTNLQLAGESVDALEAAIQQLAKLEATAEASARTIEQIDQQIVDLHQNVDALSPKARLDKLIHTQAQRSLETADFATHTADVSAQRKAVVAAASEAKNALFQAFSQRFEQAKSRALLELAEIFVPDQLPGGIEPLLGGHWAVLHVRRLYEQVAELNSTTDHQGWRGRFLEPLQTLAMTEV